MKQILRAMSKALHKGRQPEMVALKAYQEPQMNETAVQQTLPTTTVEDNSGSQPQLDGLHNGQEPEMIEFKTEHQPHLDDLHEGQEPEIVQFKPQNEPQLDETAVQLPLPRRRLDETIWLEERPKLIEAIKLGVASLRKTSAQMRTNRAARDTENSDTNNS